MGEVERVHMRNPYKNLTGKHERIRVYRTSAHKWNVRHRNGVVGYEMD